MECLVNGWHLYLHSYTFIRQKPEHCGSGDCRVCYLHASVLRMKRLSSDLHVQAAKLMLSQRRSWPALWLQGLQCWPICGSPCRFCLGNWFVCVGRGGWGDCGRPGAWERMYDVWRGRTKPRGVFRLSFGVPPRLPRPSTATHSTVMSRGRLPHLQLSHFVRVTTALYMVEVGYQSLCDDASLTSYGYWHQINGLQTACLTFSSSVG